MRSIQKRRHIIMFFVAVLISAGLCKSVRAAQTTPIQATARSAILMEAETGKIIYAKDAYNRMYPASMTKILTAVVLLEYFEPGEYIVAGNEVTAIPADSSKAGNVVGETLSVENLIRLLIIPSGNETSCIAASAVAKRVSGNEEMSYSAAEKLFADLMNNKAKELGALDTNFVNPHGYHHDNHYSTAYDLAMISRAAMSNDLIRRVVGETVFADSGAGDTPPADSLTKTYNVATHNELLMPGAYYYPYATGIKTGNTSKAGNCLAASATKDEITLIAIIFDSPDPSRWLDAITLFNYGFENYSVETIQQAGDTVGEIEVLNPRLGDPETLEVSAVSELTTYISKTEFSRVITDISIDPEFLQEDEDGIPRIKPPVEKGQILGKIGYSLDGAVLFVGDILAARDVYERTFNSDVDYYTQKVKDILLSKDAIPYWIIAVLVIIILLQTLSRARHRRERSAFSLRRKY